MRHISPAEVLSRAAAALEAAPASAVFFGSTASGRFFANGGLEVHLPQRAMGAVSPPDRGIPRDELLDFIHEAQRHDRAFQQRISAAFCFMPPLTEERGVVRPGLFVSADVGAESLAKLLKQALQAVDPGAMRDGLDLKEVCHALNRAAPADLFFGEPQGHSGAYGFWPSAWATQAPAALDIERLGHCVLVARSADEGEPAVESVLDGYSAAPAGP